MTNGNLAAEPYSALPPQGSNSANHKHALGALIIGIAVSMVAASLCLFFRRRLCPLFRQRWKHKGQFPFLSLVSEKQEFEFLTVCANYISLRFFLIIHVDLLMDYNLWS